jgi:hypothetical protein
MRERTKSLTIALLLATGCADPELVGVEQQPDPTPVPCRGFCPNLTLGWETVEFRFIVDNGPGSSGLQRRLAEAMPAFAEMLTELPPLTVARVSFVTTDDGHYACGRDPGSGGQLHLQSCRTAEGRSEAAIEACDAVCELDRLPSDALQLALGRGVSNLTSAADPGAVLACAAVVGDRGCPYSSPLAALENSPDGSSVVPIFVTQSLDCSVADNDFAREAFDPEGDRDVWPDRAATGPSESICWAAGVRCDPEGADEFDECIVMHYDSLGREVSPGNGILRPAAEDFERVIDGNKVVGLIAGVPPGWPDVPIPFVAGPQPNLPGIQPICDGEVTAVPPLRLLAAGHTIEEGLEPEVLEVGSVCSEDYAPTLQRVVDQALEPQWSPPGCVDLPLADSDPAQPGLQPSCVAQARWEGDELTPLGACGGTAAEPLLPDGARACYWIKTGGDRSSWCSHPLEFDGLLADIDDRPDYISFDCQRVDEE